MTDHTMRLFDRLMAVNWDGSYEHVGSRVALMKEYLRRATLWADEVESDLWPFFDIAATIDSSVRADDELVAQVRHRTGLTQGTALAALHFAALRDAGTPLPDLPDPFAPLIIMFERGGGFSKDGTGSIDVDMVGVRQGKREDHRTHVSKILLDAAVLDEVDQEHESRRRERLGH